MIKSRDVVVSVGCGGVGKTTAAAAIAMASAMDGRRSLVVTIDPARRLADSLGMPDVGNIEKAIDLTKIGGKSDSMFAMMLEAKRTFDNMVEKYASSPEAAKRIFANPFYQHVSGALGGSQEYMAIEKLSELHSEKKYDLIVLDTPPSAHALDFLSAPERMLEFLDQSVLQWFLKPYLTISRFSLKTFKMTSTAFLKVAEKFTGAEVIRDILDFFESFEGMYEGFRQRAETVDKALRRDKTGFVLVAAPARMPLDEALTFYKRLRKMGMPLLAVVINRATRPPEGVDVSMSSGEETVDSVLEELGASYDASAKRVVKRMWDNAKAFDSIVEHETREIAAFRDAIEEDIPIFVIPRFAEDIHSIEGLRGFSKVLFA